MHQDAPDAGRQAREGHRLPAQGAERAPATQISAVLFSCGNPGLHLCKIGAFRFCEGS